MTSIGDHLLSQQYAHLAKAGDALLVEPCLSDEDAERLVDAYERNDTSEAEFLAMITQSRPFTPPSTTHAVLIDSGAYSSAVAIPTVFKSLIHDNANAALKETFAEHGISMVQKASTGGVLLHVTTREAERKLAGQEVMLLGRKFTIKRQSPMAKKFFLDVFGVGSTETANQLYMSFAALGARPLFLTPRDVNMKTQAATPTWRFYFGQDEPPSCLIVNGFVTNQLMYGRKLFLAHGGRSLAPPERARGYKKSSYAITLPYASICERNRAQTQAQPHAVGGGLSTKARRHDVVKPALTIAARPMQSYPDRSPAVDFYKVSSVSTAQEPHDNRDQPTPSASDDYEGGGMDTEMISASSDEDVDMARHLETGFKRIERSFADKNPFAELENVDCEFEDFQPDAPSDMTPGFLIVPTLSRPTPSQEPQPTKRRSANLNKPDKLQVAAEDAVLVDATEAQLEQHEDRMTQNMQHLDSVKNQLSETKNMDKVVESMRTFPTAWSTAICSDLNDGGVNFSELTDIHLLDRILAANMHNAKMSFYERVEASQLPLGKTRTTYMKWLNGALDGQPDQVKNQWEIFRLLSSFEPLVMSTLPVHIWIQQVVEVSCWRS
ncbi:Hypothetical protein PHPALM_3945 [Phytophthora palmivora]|uniref:Uncharacterized protein n=1 Tax=Phytophthora palmivora TaxID=4796 RepID=A0A2P4YL60_9STRA|nr:Hypothetical protein PHPALM_3945 [Phytophthora palmivora]